MDPDANLAEQLRCAQYLQEALNGTGAVDPREILHSASRLAELVEALNDWITGGGCLPKAWGRGRS